MLLVQYTGKLEIYLEMQTTTQVQIYVTMVTVATRMEETVSSSYLQRGVNSKALIQCDKETGYII